MELEAIKEGLLWTFMLKIKIYYEDSHSENHTLHKEYSCKAICLVTNCLPWTDTILVINPGQ
jgi:hypothetical protein